MCNFENQKTLNCIYKTRKTQEMGHARWCKEKVCLEIVLLVTVGLLESSRSKVNLPKCTMHFCGNVCGFWNSSFRESSLLSAKRGICLLWICFVSVEPPRGNGRIPDFNLHYIYIYDSRSKVLNKKFNRGGTQPTLLYDFTSSLCGVTQGNPAKHKLGARFAQGWRKCFHVLSYIQYTYIYILSYIVCVCI